MPPVLRAVGDWTRRGAAAAAIQSALQQGFPPARALLVLLVYAARA